MKGSHEAAPSTLSMTWTVAARTPSQVPMLAPSASAIPASKIKRPSLAIPIASPTVAADECTSAVKSVPATMP
jgi:hypothetical protein